MQGAELFGYANLDDLEAGEFDEASDFQAAGGEGGAFFAARQGTFLVLAPQDAHMPGLALDGGPAAVKKVVVKVRV